MSTNTFLGRVVDRSSGEAVAGHRVDALESHLRAQPEALATAVTDADGRFAIALDAPRLVTDADVQARTEKFARFRGLAESGGDATRGRAVFTTKCLTCHQQGGQGGRIGPALDGLGLTGVEAILRHVLTPSAAMEGGYRSFRVVTRDGRVIQGLLVSRDADAIVIRQPDVADIRIAVRDVADADFVGISIMPEGLLEAMQPGEVSDLFAHLKSLTAKAP